ncbi:MAG TPA: hypothetical protein VHG08_28140 [Longimicrobium sp.]|nr:hypothetical protein [Longimicrobium sp.]
MTMRSRLSAPIRIGTLVLLLAGLAGCSLGNSLRNLASSAGGGLVSGARTQLDSDSTLSAVRVLADSATAALASGIRGNLAPALDATVNGVFSDASTFLRTTQDSLAYFLSGPLSSSLQRLIQSNVQTLGASLDAQLDPAIARAGEGLRTQLSLTLDQAGGDARRVFLPLVAEAVDTVSTRLAVNAQGPLRVAIDSIVASAVRSGLQSADTAGRPLFDRIGGILLAVAGVIVLGAMAWLYVDRKRTRQALFAIGEAVKMTDDEQVRETMKNHIKANARRRQIDGYLHTFLEKHRLLRGSEHAGKVPVGKIVGEPAAATAATAPTAAEPRV